MRCYSVTVTKGQLHLSVQLDEAVKEDGRVLVHCQAGVSRSASLVIAYLMAHSTLSVMEAFTLANHLRSVVDPSLHFLSQLQQFQESLHIGYDQRVVTNSNIKDGYVKNMISRRWNDFQLSTLPPPVHHLREDSINIGIPPEIHSFV